jgi:AcrR family transcriptional regulator
MQKKRHTTVSSPGKPVVRRRQADRSALSDRRLTEAATELLVKSGTQGTTLEAVGKRAGYSRALATHRFGSKAGLFSRVLRAATADWLERMHKAVGMKVGADALCAATDATERFIRDRPSEVRAMYLLWFQSIDPSAEYQSNILNVHRAQRRDVENWIRAAQKTGQLDLGVNPRRVAEQYCASMAGIAYQWLVNPEMPLGPMYRQLKMNLREQLQARSDLHLDPHDPARPTYPAQTSA